MTKQANSQSKQQEAASEIVNSLQADIRALRDIIEFVQAEARNGHFNRYPQQKLAKFSKDCSISVGAAWGYMFGRKERRGKKAA